MKGPFACGWDLTDSALSLTPHMLLFFPFHLPSSPFLPHWSCFCSAPLGTAAAAALCCCTHFNIPQLMLLLLVVPVQHTPLLPLLLQSQFRLFNSGTAMAPTHPTAFSLSLSLSLSTVPILFLDSISNWSFSILLVS